MKRALLLLCIPVLVSTASPAQVSLGIRTGYTAAHMQIKGNQDFVNIDQISGRRSTFHGWHLDLVINAPMGGNFYVQPLIRYISKGTSFEEPAAIKSPLSGAYISASSSIELNYLEIPVNFLYKLPLGNGKLTAGLGPYFSTGLNGRYHFNIVQNGRSVTGDSKKIEFSGGGDNLSVVRMYKWDLGGNLALGYEFNSGMMLGVNASKGMIDVDRSLFTTSKNYYYAVSIGFLFNREDY